MFNLSAVILAGGASKRMGQNKALLSFGNFDSLIEYQYNRLKPLFKSVYISTKDSSLFSFDAKFIIDIYDEYAPTIALLSIIRQLNEERFFVLSVDSPFVKEHEIRRLIEADSGDIVVARVEDKIHPMCGIYHKTIEFRLQKMVDNNNHKLKNLLRESDSTYVDFENETKFANLNTITDYKKALKQHESL